ncbi:MAG: hypothetical protein ABJH72_14090 [Reichenbachiella sp.]|uniref:hypothetical protein n=1 Tax=Reichenbachiella sp. TaxID=2184521 RepID=UPI003263403E
MKINQELIEKFDGYINNDISEESQMEFEKMLATEPELQSQFDLYKESVNALKVVAIKNEMSAIFDKKNKATKIIKLSSWRWAGIAASITIIISTVYLLTPGKSLFDQYFEPYTNFISHRSASDGSMAMFHYSNAEYEKAFTEFENMNLLNNKEKIYLGISYLAANRQEKSESIFKELLQTDQKPYAQWYLSLCYLKMNSNEQAVQILREIEIGEYKYQEASQLLDEIAN